MVIRSLGLFLVEISAGVSLLLVFYPTRILGRGFFALHGLIALSALALSAALSPREAAAPRAAALLLLTAYTLLSRVGRMRVARGLLIAAAAGQYAVLALICRQIDPARAGWISTGAVLGSLLFGTVLLTMNLGHWYLVSRSLPMSLLFRAAVSYGAACAARCVYLAVAAALRPNPAAWEALTSVDREGLFFLFRILWGIVGPLALAYFIFQTSKMRSNQAATGLLYVALVFVLVGELLSAYLTVATGFPA
ncbi:MAG: hypothetical protein ACRD16_16310 [Thermoanaerobaculia bacterium]